MAHALTRERRAAPRVAPIAGSALAHARLRPGKTARVVNLACGGALLETTWRLLPGTRVNLQVGGYDAHLLVGTILRCKVSFLRKDQIDFHGALAFDPPLPPWVVTTRLDQGWSVGVKGESR